jgi:hypothetical protein
MEFPDVGAQKELAHKKNKRTRTTRTRVIAILGTGEEKSQLSKRALEQQQHESVRNLGSRGNGHHSYKGDSNCGDHRIMGTRNWRCLCIDDNSFNCGSGGWGLVQA